MENFAQMSQLENHAAIVYLLFLHHSIKHVYFNFIIEHSVKQFIDLLNLISICVFIIFFIIRRADLYKFNKCLDE
jgi:hypothetical protein